MSSLLDEIIAQVQGLSDEDLAALTEQVSEAVGDKLFVPNVGPQTQAYFCEADELYFGGAAGAGKTSLLCGLALGEHEKSIIFRREYGQIKGIEDEMERMLKTRDGYNSQDKVWRIPGTRKVVEFGAVQHEESKSKFQGRAHDLVCVARGTEVLMGDMSYSKVENLEVGQLVMTLEGPRKIQRVHPIQNKECVVVSAQNASGKSFAYQVHSKNHAVSFEKNGKLTWLSADDLDVSYASNECEISCSSERLFEGKHAKLLMLPLKNIYRFLRMAVFYLPKICRQFYSVMRASYVQVDQEICYEGFPYSHAREQLRHVHVGLQEHEQPSRELSSHGISRPRLSSDEPDAQTSSSPLGLMDRCLFGIRLYGERILQFLGLWNEQAVSRRCLLLLADVALPSPNHLRANESVQTQKRSHQLRTYPHPYTKETRSIDQSCSLYAASFECSPVGKMEVFDIQVEEVNHYITKGGFINKNCFDELPNFLESQYRFLIGWNRSANPNQRCRVVAAGNPPMDSAGLWVIKYWAPWLDPTHPNPAKPGELRWFTTVDGEDREVDGRGPHQVGGKMITARSRTFIPGKLEDNPDLFNSGYAATLEAMDEPFRTMLREGRFDISIKDNFNQVIPTAWVREAQNRWVPQRPHGVPMCAIGVDPTGGGEDDCVLAPRYDGWFAPLIVVPGKQLPYGKDIAGLIMANRRNHCVVVIDMGGGYGGAPYEILKDNECEVVKYEGYKSSLRRTVDGKMKFVNDRSEAYWRFREALDPSQVCGSPISLPVDQALIADLTAPTFKITPNGIQITPKEEIVKKLGRSPNRADAVVMSWWQGAKGLAQPSHNSLEQGTVPRNTNGMAVNMGRGNRSSTGVNFGRRG